MSLLAARGVGLVAAGRRLLHDIDFDIEAGQRVALLGASGSGKSLLLRSLLGLPPAALSVQGETAWRGRWLPAGRHDPQRLGRDGVGMVFQGAGQALHPLRRVGVQLRETGQLHGGEDPAALLDSVGLQPQLLQRRPDQLSGGQRQRVLIALALAARPALLLADEPTASLDSVARAQILQLLQRLCRQRGLALLLVAHDAALVRHCCERALVLADGRLVEQGPLTQIFTAPRHPWTQALVASASWPAGPGSTLQAPEPGSGTAQPPVLLQARGLSWRYPRPHWLAARPAAAFSAIDLSLRAGERVALLGASGSGKSTLAKALAGLLGGLQGELRLGGRPLAAQSPRQRARRLQLVLQDARAALDPLKSVAATLAEVLRAHALPASALAPALALTGVDPEWLSRRPGQLSGGQRQRLNLARALLPDPDLLLLDEALSALDPPLRHEISQRLQHWSEQRQGALLLISHDLGEALQLCPRTLVLDAGRIVEQGPTASLLGAPRHAASRALVEAVALPPDVSAQAPCTPYPHSSPLHSPVP